MPETSEHIVKSYDNELKRLSGLLTRMGGMVESQLALACKAVIERDSAAAAAAVASDPQVDALDREVEQFAIRMLALRQPMAQDLRLIFAGLKMSAALERIGDYAANVAKRSLVLQEFTARYRLSGFASMARLVQENLKLIVDAIGETNTEKALQVWRSDAAIDELYDALFRELITYMMEDPRNITPCTHLLFIAKNLERVGDHATNIAELIHYAELGEPLADARPKGGTPAGAP